MPTTAESSGALRTWSRPADQGTRPLIHRLVAETSPQRDNSHRVSASRTDPSAGPV
jgi:hypothetical protein